MKIYIDICNKYPEVDLILIEKEEYEKYMK